MTRHAWLAVQIVVTLVLLAALLRGFDWAAFGEVLSAIPPAFYLGSLSAVVVGQLLYALRWQVILAGIGVHVTYRDVLRQYLVGTFFSNLLPTAVGGDAAKVYYLGRQAGYAEIGASVVVDRFLGFLWLTTLGATLAWLIDVPSPLFILNRSLLTIFAIIVFALLAAAWLVPADRWRDGQAGGWAGRLRTFGRALRAGACRPAALAVSAGVVLAYVALMTFVYTRYFVATGAVAPAALPLANVLVSMSVFVNIPVSLNGIGLREQLHYLLFAALGLPKEIAVGIAVLLFSHLVLVSFAGYLVWLRMRRLVQVPVAEARSKRAEAPSRHAS